jgi:hypothetical protein
MELTPEGVREHFLELKQVVNGYIREERLKGIATRLLYDEDEVPVTGAEDGQTGMPLSGFQTPPVVAMPTSANNNGGVQKLKHQ